MFVRITTMTRGFVGWSNQGVGTPPYLTSTHTMVKQKQVVEQMEEKSTSVEKSQGRFTHTRTMDEQMNNEIYTMASVRSFSTSVLHPSIFHSRPPPPESSVPISCKQCRLVSRHEISCSWSQLQGMMGSWRVEASLDSLDPTPTRLVVQMKLVICVFYDAYILLYANLYVFSTETQERCCDDSGRLQQLSIPCYKCFHEKLYMFL